MKLVGIVGLIGSGKSTAGDILEQELGFKKLAFATILKDATANLFSWPRELLEGDTQQSREFRETEDVYWTRALGRKITPRVVLQEMGTEVIRDSFHSDFWILALQQKILSGVLGQGPFVLTDCRFPNEMKFIKDSGGALIRIKRGDDPIWFNNAIKLNNTTYQDAYSDWVDTVTVPPIHPSEWKWIHEEAYYDYVVENNSTLEDLKEKIKNIGKEINL